jgi:hypothetical protein
MCTLNERRIVFVSRPFLQQPHVTLTATDTLTSMLIIPLKFGFLPHLLQLVLDQTHHGAVRLAGGVYLKNLAQLRWEEVRFNF